MRWDLGHCVACASRIGEVLVVTATGVLTVENCDRLAVLVNDQLQEQDARAVVFDMREVISLITKEGWGQIADSPLICSLAPPVALVASPVVIDALRGFCLAMAERGYVRGPFTGLHAATAWASGRREHWAHRPLWERCRSRSAEQTAHRLDSAPRVPASP